MSMDFVAHHHRDPVLSKRIDRSLRYSLREGVVAAVMIEILEYYLIPYALFLGATTQQIGYLVAVPNLLAAFSQLFAVPAVRWVGSRLRLLVQGTAAQAVLLLPVALLPLFPGESKITALILLVSFFRVLGHIIGPAWGSLVSDYLHPQQRGYYFGWRSKWTGIAGVVGVTFWGSFLYLMKDVQPAWSFVLVFLAASAFRFLSVYYMARMIDLPHEVSAESEFTFWMFLRRFRESNFVKFVFYVSSMTLATQLAAPYFSVYMLEELKFSYLTYTLVHLCAVLSGFLSFPLWGRHADRVGNARILKLTGFLIPFIPLLWIFSGRPLYLALVEVFAGFVWAGFNLCATNFIYDAVSPGKRVRCLGYFNLFNGAAIFIGAALGGALAKWVPPVNGSALLGLFALSGFLRFLADLILSRHFREVRASGESVSSLRLFFSVAGVRPLMGVNSEWEALPTVKKLLFPGKRAA